MEKFDNDHFKREEMIVRLAQYFSLSTAKEYKLLEPALRCLWSHHPYLEIIRPLVRTDRIKEELSYPQLAIKYSITRAQAWRLVNGRWIKKEQPKELDLAIS